MKKILAGTVMSLSMMLPVFASAQTVEVAPVTHVSAFTGAQISAVIEMLRSFFVDEDTVTEVYSILVGA